MENVKCVAGLPAFIIRKKRADVSHQLFNYLKFRLLPSPATEALA